MFSRADLKQKGMFAFKRNYWACVVVALIISFVAGGGGTGSISNPFKSLTNKTGNNISSDYNLDDYNFDFGDLDNHGDTSSADKAGLFAFLGVMSGIIILIIIVASLIGIAFSVFVANPLIVGCRRYFTINSYEKPLFGEVGFGFKKGNYLNIVKVEFMKNLFIFLWTLLLIIPGIIKSYEYYLVDYILSEDPTISYKDALEQSKNMMNGYKMDTFVLELSFIGWALLSALTCGILAIFYVNPYMHATFAELFLFIRNQRFPGAAPYYTPSYAGGYGNNAPQFNQGYSQQFNPGQQYTPQQPQQQYTPQQPAQQYTPQQPTQQYNPDQTYTTDQSYASDQTYAADQPYNTDQPYASDQPYNDQPYGYSSDQTSATDNPTDVDPNSYYNL